MVVNEQLLDTAYQKLVVDPLAVGVILDAASRVGGKLKNCLCSLVGQVLDDGSIHINDAFVNHVVQAPGADASVIPERTHHDFMWQARQKVNPRELIIGWGTSDLDFQSLQTLSDWARTDQKSSKFFPRKRLSSPIILKVDLPTENTDLQLRAFTKGPIFNCLMKPLPVILAPTTQGLDLVALADPVTGITTTQHMNQASKLNNPSSGLEVLSNRLDSTLKIVQDVLDGKREADPELGREIYRAVAPPIGVNLDSLTKVEAQDNLLAVYMTNLVKLQFAIGEKLHLMHA